MNFGVAWYPEQWSEDRWLEDLRLMREANFNTVRIAEFAWSTLEPEEGRFELDWLERAVSLAADAGIKVVLGIPTAAPPAWLTQTYPEVLQVSETGQRATHGYRQHYSPSSPAYRRLAGNIAGQMAARFGDDSRVVGWQVDNEFSVPSFDQDTHTQFQEWLKQRFKTLEALNTRWGTVYWSQTYSDWSQIPLPIGANRFSSYGHNPSLILEWKRFVTFLWRRFQGDLISVIREHASPDQWITHNFMGFFDGYDPNELSADLDFASWDNYTHKLDLENAAGHDFIRGLKRKNFWVMETQPGSCGLMNALPRGEVRRMAWQAVGHGADAVLYWQWRSLMTGPEQYHGTLLAQDGTPRPIFGEIGQIGAEFARAAKLLSGTQPRAEVAILFNPEDRWALDYQRHHPQFDSLKHLLSFYTPLRERGVDVDIIHPDQPLEGYKLVIAPHLHTLTEARAERLERFVNEGGHLLLGVRSGFKNSDNALIPLRQPAWLSKTLGVHIEEYYALNQPISVNGTFGEGQASLWAEWICVDASDVQVLARYGASNGWLEGQVAATTRVAGLGRASYLATWLDPQPMREATAWWLEISAIQPAIVPPAGVEVCRRISEERAVTILLNHTATAQSIQLPQPFVELFTGHRLEKSLELQAGEVAVLVAD